MFVDRAICLLNVMGALKLGITERLSFDTNISLLAAVALVVVAIVVVFRPLISERGVFFVPLE